jgi:hypothetical protein
VAYGEPDVGHPDLQVAPAGLVFGLERLGQPLVALDRWSHPAETGVIELPALPWTARQPIDPGRSYLDAFAGSEPHRWITRRLAPFMGETRFETLTVAGERLPLGWPEIQQQILGGSPRR